MRKRDQCTVWAASPLRTVADGAVTVRYTRLRSFRANVQQMRDETQQRVFGRAGLRVLVLRTMAPPDVVRDDTLYLSLPEAGEDGAYPPGPYRVLSVRPLRVGVKSARNPTEITAAEVKE